MMGVQIHKMGCWRQENVRSFRNEPWSAFTLLVITSLLLEDAAAQLYEQCPAGKLNLNVSEGLNIINLACVCDPPATGQNNQNTCPGVCPTTMSSTKNANDKAGSLAVDGLTWTCVETEAAEQSRWMIDLQSTRQIWTVRLNSSPVCNGCSQNKFSVYVGTEEGGKEFNSTNQNGLLLCAYANYPGATGTDAGMPYQTQLSCQAAGRYVWIVQNNTSLSFCEVEIWGSAPKACSRFFALVAARPSFASVSTRDRAPVGSDPLPVYSESGGPQGKGHVSFVRANKQFLDAGPRTLNIATNGGLTIVAVVRFTGDAESNERIIDLFFRGPTVTNNIMIRRCGSKNEVAFEIRGVSSLKPINGSNCQTAEQNDWLTVVVRYRASTKEYWFTVSNNVFTGNPSAAVTDRMLSSTLMAKAFSDTNFLNGDIAGVFVVDEYLSTDATTAIVNAMVRGEDLTKTSGWTDVPGSGYYNATARTLSVGASNRTCITCPAGTYKPIAGDGSCSCCANVFEPKLFKQGHECKSAALAPLRYIWSSVVECARWAGKMRYQHFAFAPDDPTWGCRICDIGVEDADANSSFNIYTAEKSGQCDVNSFSPTGSSSSSTCTCQGIWPSCTCSSDKCTCSMAVAGGNKVQDGCTCDASFWGMPGGTKPGVWHCNYGYTCPSAGCDCNTGCVSCAIATYKNWTGANACMACPIQATTLSEASTFLTQCLCNKGYTGPDGQVCNACVAGKYKDKLGSNACLDCPLGKYSPGAGSVGCLACPGNSYSPVSSTTLTQCTCNVGFSGPDGGSCTACAAGTYKNATGSATCTGCPGNSYSPVSSTTLTQCTCNVGFSGPDGGSCTACAAGTYKNATGSATCTACGSGKYSNVTAVSTCTRCAPGKYSNVMRAMTAQTCATCGSGTYSTTAGASASSTCIACPSNSNSPAGSPNRNISLSILSAALTGVWQIRVWNFPNAKLGLFPNFDFGSQSFTDIGPAIVDTETLDVAYDAQKWIEVGAPANYNNFAAVLKGFFEVKIAGAYDFSTISDDGSSLWIDNSTRVVDNGGLHGNKKMTGTVSLSRGIHSILVQFFQAGFGVYLQISYSGADTGGVEQPVDVFQTNSSGCTCNAGYYGPAGGACTACGAGKYSTSVGAITENTCFDCPPGKYLQTSGNSDLTNCTACVQGTYSVVNGSSSVATCLDCPSGKYLESESNDALSDCMACAAGKYSGINGSPSNTTCLKCPPGTYLETIGNDALSDCMACAAGKYSGINGSSSNTTCLDCSPGAYLETIGNDALSDCMACAAGKYSGINGSSSSTTCLDCPPGAYLETIGNDALSDCMSCAAGKYSVINGSSSSTTCLDCPPGTYLETIGNDALSDCMACAAGKYSVINGSSSNTTCLKCPPGTYLETIGNDALSDCMSCAAGKYSGINGSLSNTTCLDCPPGTYLETIGNDALSDCTSCAAGKYSVINGSSSNTTCLDCPPGTYLETIGNDALSDCMSCAAGKYSGINGSSSNTTCLDCPPGTYLETIGNDALSDCMSCAAGKYSGINGSSSVATCLDCLPGTYLETIGNDALSDCMACAAGKYSGINGSSSVATCLDCLPGTYLETIGNDALSDCMACAAGKYSVMNGSSSNTTCLDCPPGTYLEAIGNDALSDCTSCAAGKYSGINGSSSVATCLKCPPGKYVETESNDELSDCMSCAAGKYSVMNGSSSVTTCLKCPDHSNSSAASSHRNNCKCNPGYTSPTGDGGNCTSCAVNMYKEISGSAACLHCSTYSTSPLASENITDCVCNLGYQGQPGENCTKCPRGKYANVLRTCDDCPANAVSFKTSNVTDCLCKVGYEGIIEDENSSCTLCPRDHYKDTNSRAACTSCPPFSNASAGSIRRSDCKCQVHEYGYVWNSTNETCQLFPSFLSCGIECWMKWGAEKWICNTTCGDGLRAGSEECDDGNIADLDGCSANCSVEPRFNCTPMELPKLVATLPHPKMVAGAPSICLRDNCFQVQNTNRLSVAQAAATAAAVTAVVAGAVAVGVASGVAGAVAGGAAGGAGAGGEGGGGGGLVLLIDQVQFMNIAGRVSGSGAGEGLAAFSQGFGWANFDFPVGGGGGGGDKNVSRRQERREEHCRLEEGTPLLKKLVTCLSIICAVSSLRVLGGRVYMWYKKEEALPAFWPPFPSIEGPLFLTQMFGLIDVAFGLAVSKCLVWAMVGSFFLLPPFAFVAFGAYRLNQCMRDKEIVWVKSKVKSDEIFKNDLKNITTTSGKIGYWFRWFVAKRQLGTWTFLTPHAQFWSFFLSNVSANMWIFFAWKIFTKFWSAFVVNVCTGVAGGFMMIAIQVVEAMLLFTMCPCTDNWHNYVDALGMFLNSISLLFVTLTVLLPPIEVPYPDWLEGPVSMIVMVVSTAGQLVLTLFQPLIGVLGKVEHVIEALSRIIGLRTFFLSLGAEIMMWYYFHRMGTTAVSYVAIEERLRWLVSTSDSAKLDLAGFLCWKRLMLHEAFNTWLGARFGDVVALQHFDETRGRRRELLENAVQIVRGLAHEDPVQKPLSPWSEEPVEYPDKTCMELAVELNVDLKKIKPGKERAQLRDGILKDIAHAIEGDHEKILIVFMKPETLNTGFANRLFAQTSGLQFGLRLLPGVCGVEKRLKDVVKDLQNQGGRVDSVLMQGEYTRKILNITCKSKNEDEIWVKVFGIEHFPDICGLFDRTDPYVQLIHDRQKVKTRTAYDKGGTVSFEQILEFSRSPLSNILQVQIMDENNFIDKLVAEVEIDLDRQTYEKSNDFLHPENVVVFDCFKNGKIQGTVKLAFAKNPILGDNQNKADSANATFLALSSRMAAKIPTHLVDKFFDPLIAEFEGSKVQVIQILQDNWVRVKVIESDRLISIKGCHLILPNGARWDGLCHPNIVRLIRKHHLSLESNKESGAVVEMNLRLNMDFQTAVQEGSIQRQNFITDLKQDLAHASALGTSAFNILKVSRDSVVVDVDAPEKAAQEIYRQSLDPNSRLRRGKVTRFTDKISLTRGQTAGEREEGYLNKPRQTDLTGIGISFGRNENEDDSKTSAVFILLLRPNGPAARTGHLEPMQQLISVDGWSVYGQDIATIAHHIRGPAGTHVILEVLTLPSKGRQTLKVEVAREHMADSAYSTRKLDAEALQPSSAIAANTKKSYVSISEEYARRAQALRSDRIGNAKPLDTIPTNGPPGDPVSSVRAASNTKKSCATIETTNFRSPPNLNVSAEFVTGEQAAKIAREGPTFPDMQRDVSPLAATSKKTCADISAEYVKRSRRLLEMNPQSPSNFSAPMHSPNDAACMGSIDSYVKISEEHAKRIWALNSRKESPSFFDTPTSGDDHFKVFQAQENNNNEDLIPMGIPLPQRVDAREIMRLNEKTVALEIQVQQMQKQQKLLQEYMHGRSSMKNLEIDTEEYEC